MRENIDVTVTLADALSRPAKKAERSIEDLADEVHELTVELQANEQVTKDDAKALAALERQVKRTAAAEEKRTAKLAAQRKAAQQTAAANRELAARNREVQREATRGARALETLKNVATGTSRALKVLTATLKIAGVIGVVVGAVGLLVTLVNALGLAAYAAVAGLTPMVGLLGAMPAVIGALALGMVGVKMGFSGVGEALKQLQDSSASPQEVAKAMNELTASGRVLATTLSEFADGPLADLKERSQDALAPQFAAAVQLVGSNLMPMLSRQVETAAGHIGDMALQAAALYSTPFFRGQLNELLSSSNVLLEKGGQSAVTLLSAVVAAGSAFAPVIRDMASASTRAADGISAAVQTSVATGELTAFFERAWDTAKAVWTAIKDIGTILIDVGQASMEAAGQLGGSFQGLLDRAKAFTSSSTGQAEMAAAFAAALPVMSALGRLVGSTAETLGMLAAESGSVVRVLDALADGLPSVGQVLGLVAASVADLLESVIGLAGGMLTDLGPVVASTASTLSTSLVPALEKVVPPLTSLIGGVLAFTSHAAPLIGMLATGLAPVLTAVAAVLETVNMALGALPAPLAAAVVGFVALQVTTLFFSGSALAKGISAVSLGLQGLAASARATGAAMVASGSAMGAARVAGGALAAAAGGVWLVALAALAVGIGVAAKANNALMDSLDSVEGSIDSYDFTGMQAGFANAGQEYDDFAAKIENGKDRFNLDFGDDLAAKKNMIEGWFGDSDMEEAEKEMAALKAEAALSANAVGALGKSLGMTVGPIDGSAASARELNAVLAAARPKMDEMRVSEAQLIAAYKAGPAALNPLLQSLGGLTQAERDLGAGADMTARQMAYLKAEQRAAKIEADGLAAATGSVITKLTELNEMMVSNQRTLIGFKQTQNDVEGVLAKGAKTMDVNTQAGRDNRSALLDLAESASSLTNDVQRTKAMEEATRRIRAFALEAGKSKKEADRFADGLFNLTKKAEDVPGNVDTKVEVDGLTQADAEISSYRTMLNDIPEFVDTRITRTFRTVGAEFVQGGPMPADAVSVPSAPTERRGRPKFSGGPVGPGVPFEVNELGPELFVPNGGGAPELIGTGARAIVGFDRTGYVVPAIGTPEHLTKAVPMSVQARVAAAAPSFAAPSFGAPSFGAPSFAPARLAPARLAPAPAAPAAAERVPVWADATAPPARPAAAEPANKPSGDTLLAPPPPINIHLNGSDLTIADVERAAVAAYRRYERERKERG